MSMLKTARSNFTRDKRNVVIPTAVEESFLLTGSISHNEKVF